jgi:hypothetical protein
MMGYLLPVSLARHEQRRVDLNFSFFCNRILGFDGNNTGSCASTLTRGQATCQESGRRHGKEQRQNVQQPKNVPVPAQIQPGAQVPVPWAQIQGRAGD